MTYKTLARKSAVQESSLGVCCHEKNIRKLFGVFISVTKRIKHIRRAGEQERMSAGRAVSSLQLLCVLFFLLARATHERGAERKTRIKAPT